MKIDPIDIEVGRRLREARKSVGINQTKLGEALGISFQQIQKYERGTNRVSASMLVNAARVLGTNPMQLLPPEPEGLASPPSLIGRHLGDIEIIVEAYARMPLKLRRALLGVAKVMAE